MIFFVQSLFICNKKWFQITLSLWLQRSRCSSGWDKNCSTLFCPCLERLLSPHDNFLSIENELLLFFSGSFLSCSKYWGKRREFYEFLCMYFYRVLVNCIGFRTYYLAEICLKYLNDWYFVGYSISDLEKFSSVFGRISIYIFVINHPNKLKL